ncbi:MAG: sodium/proline symporter [Acidobacteriota bacterium]
MRASSVAILAALSYLLLTLVIGLWAFRRTRNARDFFIAGQRPGLIVTGLAAMSASFSGFVFIGGPGLTYRIGIASLFINLPVSLTGGLMCWVLAKRLRLLSEVREVFTIPDAIACRFDSRCASGLAAMAVLVGTLGYLGSQMLALGRLLEVFMGTRGRFGEWSLLIAVGGGLLVVLFYSVAGGMVAGVYTDLFQGSLMLLAATAVFYRALEVSGGWRGITAALSQSDSFGKAFLEPFGVVPVFTAMGFFFVFSIGTLGQPHVLHKFYMLRDAKQLRWMPLVIAGSQTLCVLIWLGIGLAVPALVSRGQLAPLQQPDDAAPLFLLHFTPELLAGLAFAGILAAIMSTADSFLNIGSAALVRDLPRALGRPLHDELLWGRVAVVAVAGGSATLAYYYDDLIALLGTFAFGTFGAALAPTLALGLNWRRVTAKAASASIVTGLGVNLGVEFLSSSPWLNRPFLAAGVLPAAVALAASFTVLFLVSWWDGGGERPGLPPDLEAVLEA